MIEWISTVTQGVLLGGLYALFALGLSLIFGVMRLVNIAHGDLIVVGAYASLLVVTATAGAAGVNPITSLIAVIPIMFALGYALQRGLLNRVLGADILPPLLVTFGLSIIIQNLLLIRFSADQQSLQLGGLETASFNLGEQFAVGYFPMLVFVVAIGITLGLTLLFDKTTIGRAFRATSDDREIAQLMGIDSKKLYAIAMGIALALVGVAGVFLGIRTTFAPTSGPDYLLFAFESVIIGGLGSFWGTFAGAIILGVSQTIGFKLNPGWGVLAGHLVFLAVLIFKPRGLFERTRG